MKPLISYYGGKQRLSKTILSLMPSFTTYVEPFCGGAAVFYALKPDKNRVEVLNDKDERIVTLYKVGKTNSEALIQMIEGTPYSRSCYKKACEIWKKPEGYSEVEVAWAVYVNAHQSFAHKLNSGWGVKISSGDKTPCSAYQNRNLLLPQILDRLAFVQIECDDALSVITRYDSPTTFFYCDPPYPNTEQGHYAGYTLNDYKNLIDLLATIKGRFILSNYEQEVDLPETWKKREKSLLCSVNSGIGGNATERTEVLILNYEPNESSFSGNFDDFFNGTLDSPHA